MTVRRLVGACVVAASLVAVTGCNTSALTKQELVVHFADSAPQSDHQGALKACGHIIPDAVPEPMTTSSLPSQSVGNVRFRIDHADDHDLALLENCLNMQPGVVGVEIPDLTG